MVKGSVMDALAIHNQLIIIVIGLMVAAVRTITWLQPSVELLSVLLFEISKSLLISLAFIGLVLVLSAMFTAAQGPGTPCVHNDGTIERPHRRPCFKALLIHKLAWLFRSLLLYIQEHVEVQVIPVPLVDSNASGRPIYSHLNIRVNKDEFNMPGNHIGPIIVSAVPIRGRHAGQDLTLLKEWYWSRHSDQSVSVRPQLDFLPWRSGDRVNHIAPIPHVNLGG